jgi:hypothetical protein
MIVEMVTLKDLHNVEVTKDPRYQSGRLMEIIWGDNIWDQIRLDKK